MKLVCEKNIKKSNINKRIQYRKYSQYKNFDVCVYCQVDL